MLICQYAMESNGSSLHNVSNELISYLYVIRLVIKFMILRQMDLLTSLILFADRDDPSSPMSGSSNWRDNQLDIFLDYDWKIE